MAFADLSFLLKTEFNVPFNRKEGEKKNKKTQVSSIFLKEPSQKKMAGLDIAVHTLDSSTWEAEAG